MDNITAKVSCFARAYHSMNYKVKVFDDIEAVKLLGSDYEAITQSMIQGIDFFCRISRALRRRGWSSLLTDIFHRQFWEEALTARRCSK